MHILGIDTSSGLCSVGIAGDKLKTVFCKEEAGFEFNEKLFNLMSETLSNANIKKSDLEGIAVCIGPGSFTGIRVGISVAKGLAHTLNIPIAGITVFDALAYGADPKEFPVCSLVHVKGDLIAYCVFNSGESTVENRPIYEGTFDDLAASAANFNTIFVNINGEPETRLKSKLPGSVSVVKKIPSGATIADIGLSRLRKNLSDDIINLSPVYVHAIKFRKKNERTDN